ncbi:MULTISPECIES: hypothetical protein [Enterobacterales]|uniref:hypothetical protein n=1 Tax=Enterobacterales TaxID=91347 RepID=UPI000F67616C|nr:MULTISPECIES: hypothetical protein [Enterobacterales]UAN18876.1 hypothetical protein KGP20_25285 [Enterobacter asburiae]UAN25021.1 hypothetical protein KGP25_26550 [Enterobacter sp. JBIWA003]
MIRKLFFVLLFAPLMSWGGCAEINSVAEQNQTLIPTNESGYVVNDMHRVYFYSAPDEGCKIKGLFIVRGDLINVYADYQGFSSVMFFKKNGDTVSGWVHSDSIKSTGTGVGPTEQ